jgi:hypothetical protein
MSKVRRKIDLTSGDFHIMTTYLPPDPWHPSISAGLCQFKEYHRGKLVCPAKRRQEAHSAQEKYGISQRRACRAVKISQRVARYEPVKRGDEDILRQRITELACNYG